MIYLRTTKMIDKLHTIEDLLTVLFNDAEYNYSFNKNLSEQPNHFDYDVSSLLECDNYKLFDLFISFIKLNKPTLIDLCRVSRKLTILDNRNVIVSNFYYLYTSCYYLSNLETIPKSISKFKYFLIGQPTLVIHKINDECHVIDYIDNEKHNLLN